MFRTASLRLIVTMLVLSAPVASAQEYSILDLGPIGYRHQTWSINQHGHVVGYSEELPAGAAEGFVHDGAGFTLIGHPPQTSRSDLLGINNHGEAVGNSGTVHENGQAILWTPGGGHGHIQRLGTLGGSRSGARSINDLRQVVGWSKLSGDVESRPFVWEDDLMTALPLLGGTQGSADWINSSGEIVGGSTTDTGGLTQFAVLWSEDTMTRLPPINGQLNNIASYIHDNGDIAGSIRVPRPSGGSQTRAAIWRDAEVYLDLGTLADGTPLEEEASSWASGVNAHGVVVGMSVNTARDLVPFVYRQGEMVQLDHLIPGDWELTFVGAGAINDAGQIAVSGLIPGDPSGNLHALLLTPSATTGVTDDPASSGYTLSTRAREITFVIPHATPASVRIFGPSGRLVARLVDGLTSRGEHVVVWDGRTVGGDHASTGIYFVQLKTPDHSMTSRIVLVR